MAIDCAAILAEYCIIYSGTLKTSVILPHWLIVLEWDEQTTSLTEYWPTGCHGRSRTNEQNLRCQKLGR